MSQTNYNEQDAGFLGLLADLTTHVMDSFTAEAAIVYGRFVARGTNKTKQCKLPAAATDITSRAARLGIAVTTQFIETPQNSTADPQYPANKSVNVMSFGRAWVECETATVDTSKDVYVRHAVDGGKNKLGAFSDTAGTGLVKLDNARWLSEDRSIDGKNLAIVEIRL